MRQVSYCILTCVWFIAYVHVLVVDYAAMFMLYIFISVLQLRYYVDQSGLKAIEYHMEGDSNLSLHLFQGGQVQGEGGTRIVYVPVPGKTNY